MRLSAAFFLSAMALTGVDCVKSAPIDQTVTAATDSVAAAMDSATILPSVVTDSAVIKRVSAFPADSLPPGDKDVRYSRLTEEDFRIVAEELGVELAAIKAVVLIEAGKQMKGFYAPGVPVVNFDRSMYRAHASKAKNKAGDKSAKVPAGLSGYALREWTQLVNARKVNCDGANMGTFWGMFQIGGFNYKLCGCSNINEFVKIMSESEFSQLELFAKFITNTGMLADLKNKNWAGFARKYNGASYKKRGYHTKMANAYRKFKSQQ